MHRRLADPRSVHVVRVEMASAPELNTYYDHFIGSKGIVTRETPGGVLTWPLHEEQRRQVAYRYIHLACQIGRRRRTVYSLVRKNFHFRGDATRG